MNDTELYETWQDYRDWFIAEINNGFVDHENFMFAMNENACPNCLSTVPDNEWIQEHIFMICPVCSFVIGCSNEEEAMMAFDRIYNSDIEKVVLVKENMDLICASHELTRPDDGQ